MPPKRAEATPWRRFWRRYSPYGEFPRSSITSLLAHLALVLLLILMSGALKPPEHTPPGVDVVQVGDDADAAPGLGDGLPAAGSGLAESPPAGTDDASDGPASEMPIESTPLDDVPVASVNADSPSAATVIGAAAAPSADQRAAEAAKAASAATFAAQQARQSLDRAKQRLARNLDRQSGGGLGESGEGGSGSGTGGGGGKGATGRSARTGRWILRFEHTTFEDLLAQYEGLGAELAFPLSNDKYRFFTRLTSRPPHSQTRSIDSESRLYWFEENRATVAGIAGALGTTPTAYMLALLPAALEDKMLKLELSFANLREDQIAKTEFKVVRRGGGFDVIVFAQTPR